MNKKSSEKILILTNDSGGLYLFRENLIRKIICRGSSVVVTIPDESFADNLLDIGVKNIQIPLDRRGLNPYKDIKLFFDFLRVIINENPSLVISYTIKPNVYGGIACRLAKVPYAVNITGLGTAFEGNGIVKKIVCALYGIALKKSKVVFF